MRAKSSFFPRVTSKRFAKLVYIRLKLDRDHRHAATYKRMLKLRGGGGVQYLFPLNKHKH